MIRLSARPSRAYLLLVLKGRRYKPTLKVQRMKGPSIAMFKDQQICHIKSFFTRPRVI